MNDFAHGSFVELRFGGSSYRAVVDGAARSESRLAEAVAALHPHRSAVGLLTDENVAALHGDRYAAALASEHVRVFRAQVPAGEASKSLASVERVAGAWADRLDRRSIVVALGGGVVGDLGGFVASTFMRGIPVVQVPTSLMAQVDSSIGGKTAVNLPAGKNLVGTFHQPSLVWADTSSLRTLPERELISGLAEVVKHGAIADASLLGELESHAEEAVRGGPDAEGLLARWVLWSMRIKAAVVMADERETEKAGRARLNFGHTVGHALEAAAQRSGPPLSHGEAVALGMVAAARLGVRLGVGDRSLEPRLVSLLARLGLPHDPFSRFAADPTPLSRLAVDKKRHGVSGKPQLEFVVVDHVGSATTVNVAPDQLTEILLGEKPQ